MIFAAHRDRVSDRGVFIFIGSDEQQVTEAVGIHRIHDVAILIEVWRFVFFLKDEPLVAWRRGRGADEGDPDDGQPEPWHGKGDANARKDERLGAGHSVGGVTSK